MSTYLLLYTIKSKDCVSAWITHVVLNAVVLADRGGNRPLPRRTRVIGKDTSKAFTIAPIDNAKEILGDLMDGCRTFLRGPPALFPGASYAFVDQEQKEAKKQPLH